MADPSQTELYAALPIVSSPTGFDGEHRYGHQEDAALGYNPHKRGRKSHHPLICVAARTRLCLHLEWRPGDTVSATDWQPAMEKLWSHPTIRERLWLNRGDVGFVRRRSWPGMKPKAKSVRNTCSTQADEQRAAGPLPVCPGRCGRCAHRRLPAVRRDDGAVARLEPGTALIIMRTLKPTNPSPQDCSGHARR